MQTDSMETSITNYKLRALDNPKDPEFMKAIKLYSTYINITSLTDTNEITHCVKNYSDSYPGSKFIVAGFYQNRQLIGYCQFMYISEEKIVIVDYVVIDQNYRGLNIFYMFIEKIREFIFEQGFDAKYIVAEINVSTKIEDEIPVKAQTLIRLLKSANFGEVKTLYFQPMLGADNYESYQKSILMLYPAREYPSIKKETFLRIVESIYMKHYARWYKLFMHENDYILYNKHLHDLLQKIAEKASSQKVIKIEQEENLYGEINYRKTEYENKSRKAGFLIFGFLGMLILLIIAGVVLKKYFKLEIKDQFYILMTTGILYLLILSIFSRKAAKVLNRLLEKLIEKIV